MRGLPVIVALLLGGCLGASEDTPPEPPPAQNSPEGAQSVPESDPTQASTTQVADGAIEVPILLDGAVATRAMVCVPVNGIICTGNTFVAGESSILLEKLTGKIAGGSVTLTWTPTSPATTELMMGVMQMGSACDSIGIASGAGPSPLTLELPAAERPLCAEEVLHVWVSGTLNGGTPVYYQVDTEQAFHLEGTLTLMPSM